MTISFIAQTNKRKFGAGIETFEESWIFVPEEKLFFFTCKKKFYFSYESLCFYMQKFNAFFFERVYLSTTNELDESDSFEKLKIHLL